jgi:hypothetical protein
MKFRTVLIPAVALAASFALPGVASAEFILDTGVPSGSTGPVILEASQWFAGEFAATAGETITSLSAYIQSNANNASSFTFDIYSASSFLGVRSGSLQPVFSTTGTYTASGWNTTAVDWVPTTGGDYWLALQMSSSSGRNPPSFDLTTGTGSGTAPALGFADYTGSSYSTSQALPIGLEVTATAPVPLPPSVWLFGSSVLAGLASAVRRRRPRGEAATAAP